MKPLTVIFGGIVIQSKLNSLRIHFLLVVSFTLIVSTLQADVVRQSNDHLVGVNPRSTGPQQTLPKYSIYNVENTGPLENGSDSNNLQRSKRRVDIPPPAGDSENATPNVDIVAPIAPVAASDKDTSRQPNASTTSVTNLGFLHAFIACLSVILVSELGDKTFFIAAIMAMRHPRLTVFAGAIAALAVMTILSAVFGIAATIIPRVYTYYISTALFALFGLKMLKDGYTMSATDAQEELDEVQLDLRKREDEKERSSIVLKSTDILCKDGNSVGDEEATHLRTSKNQKNVFLTERKTKSNENFLWEQPHQESVPKKFGENTRNFVSLDDIKNMSKRICNKNNVKIDVQPVTFMKDVTPMLAPEVNGTKTAISQLQLLEKEVNTSLLLADDDLEGGIGSEDGGGILRRNKVSRQRRSAAYLATRIFMQAFTMTFLAEWGDRSQLATIILAAREDVYGVIVGGILGHSMCTGLAVLGGRMIAQKISVRTVTIVGGIVFILFAISALFFDPNASSNEEAT